MRLFLAIDTPADIKRRAGELRDRLRATGADARWEPNEKLHCTIKFLGETGPDLVDRIAERVLQIAGDTPCLTVRYKGLGCFPSLRDPRVVWIGIEPADGTLLTLQRKVDEAMTLFGFAPEERRFHPHVTLARVKSRKNIRNLLTALETVTFESELAVLSELELVKSEMKPAGSLYTILKTIPLKA